MTKRNSLYSFFCLFSNACWRFRSINLSLYTSILNHHKNPEDMQQSSAYGATFIGICTRPSNTLEMCNKAVHIEPQSQIILKPRRCATKQCISNQPHLLLSNTFRAKRCVLNQSKKTHRVWTLSLIIARLKKYSVKQ